MIGHFNPLGTQQWQHAIEGLDGELFLSSRWLRVLVDTFELPLDGIGYWSDDQLVTGVPYSHISDIRGDRIVVGPFSDFVLPPNMDVAKWTALADELTSRSVPVSLMTAIDSPVADDDRFKVSSTALRQVIALDGTLEDLSSRFSSMPKRMVKRSKQSDLEFGIAQSTDELREFFELHLGVRRHKYGLLCQPYELFERLWDEYVANGGGALVIGRHEGRVVGGCLLLTVGDVACYKYAASDPDFRREGVNHRVVYEAMRYGIDAGCSHLDLGRSSSDQPGLIDFKRRFGATDTVLGRFTWTPDDYHPSDDAQALLGQLTQLLTDTDVPDSTTERAGALLYRYFA